MRIRLCHRRPDRTFRIGGYYFPICARCTGIYTGGMIFFILLRVLRPEYSIYTVLAGLLMVIPTFIDGLTQLLGYRESNNRLRFTTGLVAGGGIVILTLAFRFFFLGDLSIIQLLMRP